MHKPMPMVIFRADATKSGGVGHVMRCLALAEAWTAGGGKASLMARTKGTLAQDAVAAAGLDCREASLAGSAADATDVAREAVRQQASWIVLDGYAFDAAYEDAVRAEFAGGRIAVINDSLRASRADLFVVPTSPLAEGSRISPGPTTLLGGFQFALLRKEYAGPPKKRRMSPGSAILVVLGGTDAIGMIEPVVQALLPEARTHGWRVRVIAPETTTLEKDPHLERVPTAPSIASEIAASDLIVCTASTVALEACACGIPQVLLVVAENQKLLAGALCQLNAAFQADDASDVPAKVASALDPGTHDRMSACAAAVIDGLGAKRVTLAMAAMDFALRAAIPDDAAFTFHLSNDVAIRKASFQSQPIEWEEHAAWFEKRLADAATWMRIVEDARGIPFGVIRFQQDVSGEFVLSIALAASHRGLKLAGPILREGCRDFLKDHPGKTIRAEVKQGNIPSERSFRDAGFALDDELDDRTVFRLGK